MEVLLRQRIEKLGDRGQIVRVADGYARNYLIPQGLAILATKGVRKQAEEMTRSEARKEAVRRSHAEAERNQIHGKSVTVRARANEAGHLYGSVTERDVVDALRETHGLTVDPHRVKLEEHPREAGTFTVGIAVYHDIAAEITLVVKALEEPAKAREAGAEEGSGSTKPKPIITPDAEA